MSYQTVNRWSTKADILQDLAEVTGKYMDVGEEFIVVGEAPPPIRRCDEEDDEFNLRFSGASNPYENQVENNGPDLKGIHQMLRMLDDVDDTPAINATLKPGKRKETIITISKLDPNVPEFVPKCAIESSHSKQSFNINDDSLSNEKGTIDTQDSLVKNNDNNQDSIIDKNTKIDEKLDVSKLNAQEIKEITLKLKNKISTVSNKNDLNTKKEKNVAIAALLKLHTAPRGNATEKPLKLFTPEYFATKPAGNEVKCKIHDVVVNDVSEPRQKEDTIPKVDISEKSSENNQTTSSAEDETSTQSGKSSPKSYIETPQEMDHYPHDPNVQTSIKKVTNWLQKPESPKPKGPVVCLGPISFKKKSVKSPVSEESSSRSSSSLNVTANPIGHFVPSKRAEDLSKKYSERAKALERQSEDVWTRAINEMKAIDKKKLEQQASQSDEGSSVSTS